MTSTKAAILATLAYADVFDYPLTEAEIWRFLIQKQVSLARFRAALADLSQRKLIGYKSGYYMLKGRDLTALRINREKIAQVKLKRARRLVYILSKIPTVELIGISGALAVHNAPVGDDIDFFIITSPGRMWLTRFLTTLVADVLGVRRRPGMQDVTNKICLNMFIDGAHLKLPVGERDLYGAHEVTQLVPLYSINSIYERFISANFWVKKFLPHALKLPEVTVRPRSGSDYYLWQELENISRKAQLLYMRRRLSREIIRPDLVRFHPQDGRTWIYPKFTNRLKAIRSKTRLKFTGLDKYAVHP